MKFAGCVQARLGSSRLPEKVLKPLAGKPMISQIVSRLAKSRVSDIVIATSDADQDQKLVDFAIEQKWKVYRDKVDDIVSRLHGALKTTDADALVRVWGDCPFICPDIIDGMIKKMEDDGLEFIHNSDISMRTYPPGLDIEIYRRDLLEEMHQKITDSKKREFPVEFVKARPNTKYFLYAADANHSKIHLTVDYAEDMAAAEKLWKLLEVQKDSQNYKTLMDVVLSSGVFSEFSNGPRNIEYMDYLKSKKDFKNA